MSAAPCPSAYALEHVGQPFVIGTSDCASFAMGWAERALGATRTPRSSDPQSVRAMCRLFQDRPLVELARDWAAQAGLVEVAPPAQRGDIGVIAHQGGPGLAIFLGHAWVSRTENGLAFIAEADALLVLRGVS
jgi:hypothetical protein